MLGLRRLFTHSKVSFQNLKALPFTHSISGAAWLCRKQDRSSEHTGSELAQEEPELKQQPCVAQDPLRAETGSWVQMLESQPPKVMV